MGVFWACCTINIPEIPINRALHQKHGFLCKKMEKTAY